VDHVDLLDRNIEKLGDVLAGGLGDSDDRIGARRIADHLAIIGARRCIQNLGVVHKCQVVNRHHRRTGAPGWGDKIGAMQYMRPGQQHF
jgi:hypothetical protein